MELSKQIAIRLPPEMLDRLDAYAAHMTEQTPGRLPATRADAVRSLLSDGLAAFEQSRKRRK